MARKRPMTTEELFNIVNGILKEKGKDVHVIEESGEKSKWGYSCGTMEAALKRKNELLMKYNKVIVRNNATRKEKIYENGG